MGQYYYVVNMDRREYIHPHKFGDGLKLLEFGASGEGTMLALAVLLADGNNRGGGDLHSDDPIIGSWKGDRIAIVGDYADPWRKRGSISRKGMTLAMVESITENANKEIAASNEQRGTSYKGMKPGDVTLYHACSEGHYRDISEDVIRVVRIDQYLKTFGRLPEDKESMKRDDRAGIALRPDMVFTVKA